MRGFIYMSSAIMDVRKGEDMQRLGKQQDGFTLLELLTVIVSVLVLAGIIWLLQSR
jgi:hypothetical protein